ncbi:MAG: O-antigen ligase family protein [Armatimonadota bacterium]
MQQDPTGNVEPAGGNRHWSPDRISVVTRNALIVVVAGVVLGVFVTTSNFYYIAAAITLAVLVVLVSWQFEVALAIYVLVAFIPCGRTPDLAVGGSGAGKGLYVSEAMLGFLLLIWSGKYLLDSLVKPRIPTGFYAPIALYLAYCVVNVVHSFLFWDPHVNHIYQHISVNAIELVIRFISAGALVLMATAISSPTWLRRITYALIAAGIYNAANALTGLHIPLQAPWWPLLTFIPAGYACAIAMDGYRAVWVRVSCTGVVLACVFVVFVKGISWVTGWLGLFTALGTVVFLSNRRLFLIAGVVLCIGGIFAWPYFKANVVEPSQKEGDYDRFALFQGAWKYATTFPLGVGLGNYRSYNSFHYGEKWGTTSYTSAHGTYSQALSETGIPGFVLFCAILIGGFRWLLYSYMRSRDRHTKMFLLAALGHTVGVASAASIGDYIIPSYHNGGLITFSATIYTWLIWGLAIAHVRISGKKM